LGGDSRARAEQASHRACDRAHAHARAREVLPADFYARPVLDVARDLIGCVVEHDGLAGLIVETEAYHESEPACHAFVGVTPRTRTLYDEPGTAYVYRSYGIHALLNAVCEPHGVGAAVLVRALEPLAGVEEMRARRSRARRPRAGSAPAAGARHHELCSGPGKLTQALGVELGLNGTSLITGPVTIRPGDHPLMGSSAPAHRGSADRQVVITGPRIGITKATDLPWRFCLAGSPHVSRPRPRAQAQVR
jgi:DNA-3-methyladenine glycosylase